MLRSVADVQLGGNVTCRVKQMSLSSRSTALSNWSCFYSSIMHVTLSGFSRSLSLCQVHQDLSDGRHQCRIQASQIKLFCFTSYNKHMADIDAKRREECLLSVLKRYDVMQVSRSACLTQWKFQWLSSSNDVCIDSNEQFNDLLHGRVHSVRLPCVSTWRIWTHMNLWMCCRGKSYVEEILGLRGESDEFWYRKEWKPWIR